MLGSTSLDEQDISILDNVLLALGHDLTSRLDGRFVAKLLQDRVVVHDDLDEGLLEISVDDTGSSGRLDALADGPLSDLIRAGGEKAGQVQSRAHGGDDTGQSGLGAQLLALLLGGGFLTKQSQAFLELRRDGQQRVAGRVGVNPLLDLGEVLVLLADVVLLAQVDQVDNRLSREEEQRVDDLDLNGIFRQ